MIYLISLLFYNADAKYDEEQARKRLWAESKCPPPGCYVDRNNQLCNPQKRLRLENLIGQEQFARSLWLQSLDPSVREAMASIWPDPAVIVYKPIETQRRSKKYLCDMSEDEAKVWQKAKRLQATPRVVS